jgi:hypothetical protein
MWTSWPRSRPVARAGRTWLLAGLVLGLVLWLSGCGRGDSGESATRPSTERSGTRTTPSVSELPSVTPTAPTRTTRTSAETPTSDQPSTSVEPPTSRTSAVTSTSTRTSTSVEPTTSPTNPPTTPPTTSAAGTPASAESQGLGALGWTLLILLVVGLIAAAWMIWRSRRRSAWDAEAGALEQDTRAVTSTQLPSVLTAETAGQRALSWPPLRAALVDLQRRWDLLAERAADDRRRDRSTQIRGLLQELVAAVDAENEALATGRDWRLLRPRVDQVGQALSTVLAGGPQGQPPPGGDPGWPAPGG